jgi:hypothetical protein
MFLKIENQGVAPLEAFTVLGDSGSRHRDGLIGQFGSGNKHGINLLLRKNIKFKICAGRNTLRFFVEVKHVTEADGTVRESFPVKCRVSGKINRTIDCGWTLEFGALDWTDTRMALREFVSNALDCSSIMGSNAVVEPSAGDKAKDGVTRIYVDLTDSDVAEFHRELGKHFLHFSGDRSQLDKKFLKKNPDSVGPRIYLNGVFINELKSKVPSVFDYNFQRGDIRIDECRNSDEYALKARIAQLVNKADKLTLGTLFHQMAEGDTFEAALDDFYLGYTEGSEQKDNWTGAWEDFAGEGAVVATQTLASSPIAEHVEAKGVKVVALPDSFAKVAQTMGISNVATVLGSAGATGKVEVETTVAAFEAVQTVWDWCETAGMTFGKPRPVTKCFKQLMDGEGETLGYFVLGGTEVFIREDLAGKLALKTAIEEVAHYITGSTDCSRDFQNFAFDMIVELCV